MVARRFYVARKLEMGLNFSMLIHLLLGASVAPFSFILPQIYEKPNFQGTEISIPQIAMLYLL